MTTRVGPADIPDPQWRSIYRIGGIAAWVAAILFRRNLAEEYLLFRGLGVLRSGPTALPDSPADWFTVLHNHTLIGLTFLGLFDAINYALVGLIFLALCAGLRGINRSLMLLAMTFTVIAVSTYFASNQAFALLSLSDQYSTATTDAQRAALIAAGHALLTVHNTAANYGKGPYLSFLFIGLAGLIIAVVMRRSPYFGKLTAWMGILANLFGLGYYVTLLIAPWSVIPLSTAAPFLLVWYLLVGRKLLRLRSTSDANDGTSREV